MLQSYKEKNSDVLLQALQIDFCLTNERKTVVLHPASRSRLIPGLELLLVEDVPVWLGFFPSSGMKGIFQFGAGVIMLEIV